MEKILISACLLGDNCKYDGTSNKNELVERLQEYYDLVPFCPEVEGGLSIPRDPSEIKNGVVKTKKGKDVTSYFNKGAERALNICKHAGISLAILKENSPSCGVYSVYNGNFNGTLVKGSGVTTQLLKAFGIKVISDNELQSFVDNLDFQKSEKIKGREKKIEEEKAKKEAPATEENTESEEKKTFAKRDRSFKKDFSNKKPFRKSFNKDGDSKEGRSFKKSFHKDGEQSSEKSFKKPFKKSFHKDGEGFKDRKFNKPFKKSFHKDGEESGEKSFKKSYKKSFHKDGDKHSSFHKGDRKSSFKKPFKKSFKTKKD